MRPNELEYLAESTMTKITPKFSSHRSCVHLASDVSVGPFEPGIPIEVPLWMAIDLKQKRKCEFLAPDWFTVEGLEQHKQTESETEYFTAPPHEYYMEISKLLLQYGLEDIPKADTLRTLIKDIWDLRLTKLRNSLELFVCSDNLAAKVNNVTMMELNAVRSFMTASLDCRSRLKHAANLNNTLGTSTTDLFNSSRRNYSSTVSTPQHD